MSVTATESPVARLKSIKQRAIHTNLPRWLATTRINVGMSTCEIAAGSPAVLEAVLAEVKRLKARDVHVGKKGCVGRCHLEPTVEVFQRGMPPFTYDNVTPAKARRIVRTHLKKTAQPAGEGEHRVSEDLLTDRSRYIFGDIGYFAKQKRMVLRNCGVVDPESLDDYLAVRGYEALARALEEMRPQDVIDEVKKAGLRGRGGGGFPTGAKWQLVADQPAGEKYVICNADEGDPGAFMDRSAIEGDPYTLLEAMAIGGYAVGAPRGIIYIRAEYPLAVARLGMAIGKARAAGLLGEHVLGTDFSFDLDLVLGAGAFVCGEETALINSIMGNRGMPRTRPPYPSVKGLWDRPTVINNVETWASIPVVLLDGADYFAGIGTEKSKGTKVFALAGKVQNTGLVEVPMGTPLGEIIFDIGGGIKGGNTFKAAQTGGPSGGCLPVRDLNTPIDYESLASAGSIMGSGGLIVMDDKDCMVDVARFFLEFTQDESCGKCTPCREGTKRMLEILNRITRGEGREGDIEKLERLGQTIRRTALCGLGQTAPNPVLSTIRHFRDEYEAHIRERRCPAAVCGELFAAPCQHTCPVHIDIPGFVGAIRQKDPREAIRIILRNNPLPSVCGRVCNHPCEANCRRGKLDEPVSIMLLKRFAADYTAKDGIPLERVLPGEKRPPVAVVGSGPSGLACAYHLAKRGYPVTVFEAEKKAGGMLALGIPGYRLPKDILGRDVARIVQAGVTVKTGVRIGTDMTVDDLFKKGFRAVFLGVGAWQETPLGLPGSDLAGVLGSLAFLKAFNTGKVKKAGGAFSLADGGRKVVFTGRRVAVVGGGNAAMDVARTCLRLGAAEVHVIYRRSKEAMPAIREEVEEAEREGVRFHFLVVPKEVRGTAGRASGLVCACTTAGEFDASGRRRPVPTKEELMLPCDIVIAAIGAKPALSDPLASHLAWTPGKTLEVDPLTLATNTPGIFAGGDLVTGGGTVIESMAQGEKAAVSIDRYIRGKDLRAERFVERGARKVVPYELPDEVEERKREEAPRLPLRQRLCSCEEVEFGYPAARAFREAARCIRCDRKEKEETHG